MKYVTKTPDRWLVVVGAMLIQLALGAIYAWSVFTARLTDSAGAYAFSASQTAWVFSAGLATTDTCATAVWLDREKASHRNGLGVRSGVR